MAYIDFILLERIWLIIALWVLVYIGDYYLTIIGARSYRQKAKEHIIYEGSYELTPQFQQDINALRTISPRFLGYVALSCVILYILWFVDASYLGGTGIFAMVIGALFLREAAVYTRHFRVIDLYRQIKKGAGVEGEIRYQRWLLYQMSGTELFIFSVLYLVLYLLFGSWFLLGGVFSCLVTALQHWRWSRKTLNNKGI